MKLTLIQTGKTTEKYIVEGVNLYSGRINKYLNFDILTVPELRNTKNMPLAEQKLKEGEKIAELISADDYIVLLDENGSEYDYCGFCKVY